MVGVHILVASDLELVATAPHITSILGEMGKEIPCTRRAKPSKKALVDHLLHLLDIAQSPGHF